MLTILHVLLLIISFCSSLRYWLSTSRLAMRTLHNAATTGMVLVALPLVGCCIKINFSKHCLKERKYSIITVIAFKIRSPVFNSDS